MSMNSFKILSEKPAATIISASMIKRRMDAGCFQPTYLKNESNLLNGRVPHARLGSLYKKGNYGSLPDSVDYASDGIALIRGTDLQSMAVNLSDAVRVPEHYYDQFKKAQIKSGDILMLVKGASIDRPDSVAMFPETDDKAIANGSVFIVTTKSKKVNSRYLFAVMTSESFLLQKRRGSSNTGALYNDLDTIKAFIVPLPDQKIQDYIGTKVELADKCRGIATKLKATAKEQLERSIQWDTKFEEPLLSHWLMPDLMSSRMDLNFNSPRKIQLIEFLKDGFFECKQLESLVDISAMIGWKGLTTEHYVDEGPWLLRGVEYRDGYIDFDVMVSVEQYKYDEQPQIHLSHKDIAMTKDGTIGKAIVVPKLNKPMAAGSTIARLRIKNGKTITPYYLELVINHPVVQIQIQSFATGLAQPHITQEWIAQLIIPRIESKEKDISTLIEKHHHLMQRAHDLSKETKSDVEALIEGKLDLDVILYGKLKAPTWEDIEKELEGI